MTDKVGGLNATNMPVRALITMAYGIRDFQLSGGPGWIGTERYDIIAKPERNPDAAEPPADTSTMTDDQIKARDAQWKERAQALLAERFGLAVHKEMKEQPIYVLTVAKNGPKLTLIESPGARRGITSNRGRIQGYATTMEMLALNLASTVGKPVIDKTGLNGRYDWVLQFAPDEVAAGSQNAENPGPTLFTALQEQVGLKLDATKGPVENVVIDHIDRPSPN